jgi:tRNA(Ile)-lysidine synthase
MPSATTAPALVAVSGGRDSVALLHWLLSQGHSPLIVCHLNHALRGRESGKDAAFVRRLAKKHGLPCEIRKADAAAYGKKRRMSVETAGRLLRHDFLGEMALKHSAQRIYLAHHADDQAETILAHLCRGAGLTGASGMAQETEFISHGQRFQLVRPLLHWRRAEIDAYIREHRLTFREDSSNISRGPRRNRLRHEALPLLSQIFERDVAPIIARCGQLAARDDAALWSFALHLSKEHLLPDGSLKITATLKHEPPAILSRLLRWWLVESLKLYDLGHAEIEHALTMLQPGGPAKINLSGGHHLRRKAGRLWVQPPP